MSSRSAVLRAISVSAVVRCCPRLNGTPGIGPSLGRMVATSNADGVCARTATAPLITIRRTNTTKRQCDIAVLLLAEYPEHRQLCLDYRQRVNKCCFENEVL